MEQTIRDLINLAKTDEEKFKEKIERYIKSDTLLNCLECWGVDNWEGYGEAHSEYREIIGEEE